MPLTKARTAPRRPAALLLDAVNADLEQSATPDPEAPTGPARIPGYVAAAFAPLPTLSAGQHLTREHAVCLDAYRHACGLPAWLNGRDAMPGNFASEINQAVAWWNSWHTTGSEIGQ